MKANNKPVRSLGLVLLFAGALLGMALFGGFTWADLESFFYFGNGIKGDTKISLNCPLIMTPADLNPMVSTVIKNSTGDPDQVLTQIDISNIMLVRSAKNLLHIPAHQDQPLHWGLTGEDVVFGHLVLAHFLQYRSASLPSADGSCGTFYLKLGGLTGLQTLILALCGTLLGLGSGLGLWAANSQPLEGRRREQFMGLLLLAGAVGLGILFGVLGLWGLGIALFALCTLLVFIMIGSAIMGTSRQ